MQTFDNLYITYPRVFALFKWITWDWSQFQDEISGTEGKDETMQTFGGNTNLANILQIIPYCYYPTLDIPEDVIRLA